MCKYRVVTDFAREQIGWIGFYVIHTDQGCLYWDKRPIEGSDSRAIGFACSEMKQLGQTLEQALHNMCVFGRVERVIWCERRNEVPQIYDEILA
jgi:hypothetical protein